MAYGPQVVLGKEGLGRYIGNLIKGFVSAGHKITIACPKWSLNTIDDLFQDFQISEDKVNFIVSNKIPVLWYFYEKKTAKGLRKRSFKYRTLVSMADLADFALSKLISVTSMALFFLLIALSLVFTLISSPIVLVGFLLYCLYRLIKAVISKGKFSLKDISNKVFLLVVNYSSHKLSDLHTILADRRDSIVQGELVKKVNRSDKESIWFIPALFWPQIKDIKKLKVVCAPDLVTEEFPALFANTAYRKTAAERCRSVLINEKYFITYCDYMKRNLLIDRYCKDSANVIAIPHINNSMSEYITMPKEWTKRLNSTKDFTQAFARSRILDIKRLDAIVDKRYIETFDTAGIRFIFYASQNRPYKNILNLVKAYEFLLRKRYINFKLVMTCDLLITDAKGILDYIIDHRLEYDVLAFNNVTVQQLAGLYKCADLVVNPTLYEGGFPFTFGEGMSVGTPSVMGDIPQTRDVVEPYGIAEDMLFDPYDWKNMADRIEYGLMHREELYQKELPLYRELEKRTGDVVAEDYVRAFEKFIELDKTESCR